MEKIKSFTELKNKHNHNMRLINVPNSDQSNDVKVLLGTNDLISDVRSLLKSRGIDVDQLRKDAVIATELVLSLSPSFFTDGELDYKGKFNKNSIMNFAKVAKKHIKARFGQTVAAGYLHLDESTPHIHFFVIPIVCDSLEDSKYRLSCKDFFDKTALINLQADYCRDFNNDLGREYVFEYKKNGKATHTTLKEFYKGINKTKEVIEAKELEIKNLNSQLVLNKYLADSKIELLEKKNENLESENNTLKSILSSVKVTISRYFTDKLKFFDFDVLHFFRIKTDNEEKSETEKMIEYFERNELDKQLNNPNESNEDNEDFYRNLNLKLKPKL